MSFVGIDIGGTYVKTAAFDPGGPLLRVERRPIPPFLDATGRRREIDPDELLACIDDAVWSIVDKRNPVEGVLVTGQMAGSVRLNDHGAPVTAIATWQDQRGDLIVDQIRTTLGERRIRATGNELRPGLPIATWAFEHIGRQFGFNSLIGYVAGAICDRPSAITHVTDAASSGLFDLSAGTWSRPALRIAGLTVGQMPRVVTAIEPVGLHVSLGAPVYCAVGDQQASLFGAGLRRSEISLNIATGGQVSILADSLECPSQVRPYFDGRVLHTITHLPAGRALTKVVSLFRPGLTDADWRWASEAARRPPTISCSPNFFSLDGGAFHGVAGGSDPEDFVAATVESLAEAYAVAVTTLATKESDTLLFSGGLAQRFEPLRSRIAAALDSKAIRVHESEDAALLGLACLATRLSPGRH